MALTTIKTGGIADNAITNAKMADDAIDSADFVDGSIDNAHLAGSIAVSKTLLSAGTGLTLSTNSLAVDASQTQITSVGTLAGLTVDDAVTFAKSTNGDYSAKIYNANAGSSTEANIYITNSSSNADGLFAGVGGTGFTTASGFVQDSAWIGSGSGASGGLSIMTRANADMRFYTNGHTNLALTIDSSQNATFAGNVTLSGSSTTRYLFLNSGGNGGVWQEGNYELRFGTNDTERMKIEGDGTVVMNGALQPAGNVTIGGFARATSYIQTGAGATGTTNADNWQFVSKSTTGGTIASGGGMGYFALGDNYTTSDAILMVRNDGNRGSFRHASGSSLIKAQFNDGTAFEVTKDGMIKGMQGAPARIAGNWEVVDVVSAKNNSYGHIQSDNCFNDNIYSQFKIIIPYINCDTQETTLLFSLLYNSGSGLTEDTGDYYVSMDLSPHNTSSYQGGTQTAGTRAQIFGAMHSNTAVGVSGHIDVYEVSIADLRQYNQFSANTMRSGDGNMDNDRGSKYRPMMNCELMGYNEDHNAYTKQTTIVRANTERHASYWKGFRLQCSSGNIGAGSQVIVLGRAL